MEEEDREEREQRGRAGEKGKEGVGGWRGEERKRVSDGGGDVRAFLTWASFLPSSEELNYAKKKQAHLIRLSLGDLCSLLTGFGAHEYSSVESVCRVESAGSGTPRSLRPRLLSRLPPWAFSSRHRNSELSPSRPSQRPADEAACSRKACLI